MSKKVIIDRYLGEWPNAASVPSHRLLSIKRPRDKEVSSNDDHLRDKNGPRYKTATTGPAEVVDLEFADEVEVSPHNKKRRGVVKSEGCVKNDTAGRCSQIGSDAFEVAGHRVSHEAIATSYPMNSYANQTLKGLYATQKGVSIGEDAQVANHREFHKAITAAALYPMNVHSDQTSRDDGSADEYSQKLPTSKPPSNASGRQFNESTWEARLSELADYRKMQGHCNVPSGYSKNTKLANWVAYQRRQYRLHLDGKKSSLTLSRIQELESLGFDWGVCATSWEDRFSELADYRKIHAHCNVPYNYSQNAQLAAWVGTQRREYRFHRQGKKSNMTIFRIQEMESLNFEWNSQCVTWETRLSELAEYRRIHGHCNVPQRCSEYPKLATWVLTQRRQYRGNLRGQKSHIKLSRIQELERLGFNWGFCATSWEDRLSELAEYRIIHGHCNVSNNCSENTRLAYWVGKQRCQYRLHQEGKKSFMTTFRIQELESIGFEWDSRGATWEDRLSELAEYHKVHGHCIVIGSYSGENSKLGQWVAIQKYNYRLHLKGMTSPLTLSRIQALENIGMHWK
jgi:hypothetical protein